MKRITSISALIVIVVFILFFITGCSNAKVITTSDLIKAIDVEELSTAEFIYNGITAIKKGNETYHVRYNSTVKVGISMDDVEFEVDHNGRKITITLPDITINDILVDASSISYIPINPNVDVKDVLAACKADVENEAKLTDKLSQTAEDNLQSIIIALIDPIIKDEGYSFEWYRIKTTIVKEAI